jgi:phage FluMu protein gp41
MSQALTISGELPGGVEVDGVMHFDFTLRLPTVLDNVEAVDEVGAHNAMALSASILTRQIVKLGTLKGEQITYDLVVGMHPSDFNVLEIKAQELEKKRKEAQSQRAPTSSASGSPSAAPA